MRGNTYSLEARLPVPARTPSNDVVADLPIVAEGRPLAYHFVKRVLDLVLATALLVVLSPLFVAIAIAIKLDSPGPALFRQRRVGARRRRIHALDSWGPRIFTVLKFRTMIDKCDESVHETHIAAFVNGELDHGKEGAQFKLSDDPRQTSLGRFLRQTSLDELPQLLNVLRGQMSLVGPRPVPIYEAEHYTARERRRLTALPGITGLWQVSGRADIPYEAMIALDLEYLRRQSLWFDLKILALTIPEVLGRRGAA